MKVFIFFILLSGSFLQAQIQLGDCNPQTYNSVVSSYNVVYTPAPCEPNVSLPIVETQSVVYETLQVASYKNPPQLPNSATSYLVIYRDGLYKVYLHPWQYKNKQQAISLVEADGYCGWFVRTIETNHFPGTYTAQR